jgi:hypothetical protein
MSGSASAGPRPNAPSEETSSADPSSTAPFTSLPSRRRNDNPSPFPGDERLSGNHVRPYKAGATSAPESATSRTTKLTRATKVFGETVKSTGAPPRKIHLYRCEANEEGCILYHSEAQPLLVRMKKGSRKELGFLAPSGERKSQDHDPL